jgi:hypothetical protein
LVRQLQTDQKKPQQQLRPIAKDLFSGGATLPAILTIVAMPAPPNPNPINVVAENNVS